jgi:hypothetical protein
LIYQNKNNQYEQTKNSTRESKRTLQSRKHQTYVRIYHCMRGIFNYRNPSKHLIMNIEVKLKKTLVKFNVRNKKIEFIVYQNLLEFFDNALTCWLARANNYTKEDLCEYINSKNLEYRCMTKQDYGQL